MDEVYVDTVSLGRFLPSLLDTLPLRGAEAAHPCQLQFVTGSPLPSQKYFSIVDLAHLYNVFVFDDLFVSASAHLMVRHQVGTHTR